MNANSIAGSGSSNNRWKRARGATALELLIVIAMIALLVAFFLPVTRSGRSPTRRSQCKNNLKQIGLALHNYHDTYGAFPPAYVADENGKPLHSWRTLILPFVDQAPLYNTIDLSKPWDDPANAKAYQADIPVYRCPEADCPGNHTTYLAIVTPKSCLRPNASRSFSEIQGNPAETIRMMVIEVDAQQSVHWMSPVDGDESFVLGFGPESELAHSSGMHALFMDGSVWMIEAEMPAAERRALISTAGREL